MPRETSMSHSRRCIAAVLFPFDALQHITSRPQMQQPTGPMQKIPRGPHLGGRAARYKSQAIRPPATAASPAAQPQRGTRRHRGRGKRYFPPGHRGGLPRPEAVRASDLHCQERRLLPGGRHLPAGPWRGVPDRPQLRGRPDRAPAWAMRLRRKVRTSPRRRLPVRSRSRKKRQ